MPCEGISGQLSLCFLHTCSMKMCMAWFRHYCQINFSNYQYRHSTNIGRHLTSTVYFHMSLFKCCCSYSQYSIRALRYLFDPLAQLDKDLQKCTCPDLKQTSPDLKCINFQIIYELYIVCIKTCIKFKFKIIV